MHFDVTRTNQAEMFCDEKIKKSNNKIYKFAVKCSTKNHATYNFMRLTGPIVALGTVATFSTVIIVKIAERVIKGLANILGCIFFKECNFFSGVKQLTWDLLVITTLEVAVSSFSILKFSVVNTVLIAKNPKNRYNKLASIYLPKKKSLSVPSKNQGVLPKNNKGAASSHNDSKGATELGYNSLTATYGSQSPSNFGGHKKESNNPEKQLPKNEEGVIEVDPEKRLAFKQLQKYLRIPTLTQKQKEDAYQKLMDCYL